VRMVSSRAARAFNAARSQLGRQVVTFRPG
jgi:hypothetical protein